MHPPRPADTSVLAATLPYLFRWHRDILLPSSCMSETLGFWISQSFEGVFHGSKSKIASASTLPRTPQLLPHSIFCLKCMCVCLYLAVSNSATPWAAVHHTPVSLGFSMLAYWSGLPCSSPQYLTDPGIQSLASPASTGGFFAIVPAGRCLKCKL